MLFFEPPCDAAHRVLADLHLAQGVGDPRDLTGGDSREVHLQDRLLHVAGDPLVALEDLRYELSLAVSRDLQALYLARGGHQIALVVSVALAFASGGELPVVGVRCSLISSWRTSSSTALTPSRTRASTSNFTACSNSSSWAKCLSSFTQPTNYQTLSSYVARESMETKSFLRIGTKVRVREGYGSPYQRGGQSGTIT